TGLLPILIGEATKLAQFLEGGDKEYRGVIQLGVETDTLDCEGQIIRREPVPHLESDLLADVARQFTGTIEQVPPIYSAIKREGTPMYKLARREAAVEPPPPRS